VKVRSALRAATAAHHERVDRLFSRLNLADPHEYGLFLLAQASAHIPVEEALDAAGADRLVPDWPDRRRAPFLREDLAALGEATPHPITPPPLADNPSMLGAIYVLEGSRLGGALLKKQLPAGAPSRFLSAKAQTGAWRKLLENLETALYREDLIEAAAVAAKSVFQRFEAGGLSYLESDRACVRTPPRSI
jgi:heme oxygenase (biliverdin-IX-beta and delta-forming)